MQRLNLLETKGREAVFQNRPGLQVRAHYERSQLGGLVRDYQPDAALLLSVYPETFCYTLSEMMTLQVPVVATRLGALAERIEDGVSGFLIEPDADALLACLDNLYQKPELLDQVRRNLGRLRVRNTQEMVSDYHQLLSPAKGQTRGLADLAITGQSQRQHALKILRVSDRETEKSIFYAWEFGAALGHVGSFMPLARNLREHGYTVHWAVAQTAQVGVFLAEQGFACLPAPSVTETPAPGPPLSYADILLRFGYADARALFGLVTGWRELMRLTGARLVLADHAPSAILAARTLNLPVMLFSNGFTVPPRQSPLPAMRPWSPCPDETLVGLELAALKNVNSVLAQFGCSALPHLANLFDVAEDTLVSFPELDHYPHRGAARYWGSLPSAGTGIPCTWPKALGPKVFAYLRRDCIHHEAVLAAMLALGYPSIIYFPDMPNALQGQYAAGHLQFLTQPADMTQMTREADFAVTYASLATTTAFLLAGKPLLLLPSHLEQFLVARRVVELGAGVLINPEQPPADLCALLTTLVTDLSMRQCAQAFAQRYAAFDQNQVLINMLGRIEEMMVPGTKGDVP